MPAGGGRVRVAPSAVLHVDEISTGEGIAARIIVEDTAVMLVRRPPLAADEEGGLLRSRPAGEGVVAPARKGCQS